GNEHVLVVGGGGPPPQLPAVIASRVQHIPLTRNVGSGQAIVVGGGGGGGGGGGVVAQVPVAIDSGVQHPARSVRIMPAGQAGCGSSFTHERLLAQFVSLPGSPTTTAQFRQPVRDDPGAGPSAWNS